MYVATHYYHHQHRIPASARLISTEIDTPWQMSSYKYYSDSVSWSGSSDSEYAVREVHLFFFCFFLWCEIYILWKARVFFCCTTKSIKIDAVYNVLFVTRKVLSFERTLSNYVLQVNAIFIGIPCSIIFSF